MFILGIAAAAFVIVLMARRHWVGLNSSDMGTMSEQWLAEYQAEHP